MAVNEKNKDQNYLPKKQPKVKTSPYNKKNKITKIIKVLDSHPEGLTPKYIASQSSVNHNTVKTLIVELEKLGIVKRKQGIRGYYVLVENPTHALNSYSLQNIVLSYTVPIDIEFKDRVERYNDNFSPLVKYDFEIGKESRKATLHVSTDYPFNVSAVSLVVYFFKEIIEKHTHVKPREEEIFVSTFEVNKDHIALKLDGCNCITVESYIASFKAYNKRNCLREEYKIKIPIRIDFLNKLITQGLFFTELNVKDDYILEEIKSLKKQSDRILSFCSALLKKISGDKLTY